MTRAQGFVPLDPMGFGLAAGIVMGGATLLFGLLLKPLALQYGMGHAMVGLMTAFFPGYSLSYVGAMIAGIWSFLKSFVLASAVAWLYNKLV